MVMRDIQKREAEDIPVKYVNYILRDDRKSCAEPYCTPAHAVSVYHSVSGQSLVAEMTLGSIDSPASNGRREEFQRIANLMKKFYEGVRDDPEHYLMAPSILGAACPPLPETGSEIATRPVPPPNPKPSVSISSMGRIDSVIQPDRGDIQAYDPWVTGEELGNGLGLFLGTYRGQLGLSVAYNDTWHDDAGAKDFLNRCNEVVVQNML